MGWFNYKAILGAILILVTLVKLNYTYKLPLQGQSGVHLAHKCVNLHGVTEGGAPVIMLHGLTSNKETWDGIYQIIPFLTRRRVCMYDARNHGDSGWNDTFNIDVLAEDLGKFMKDMKIEKAALVGHSLGGLTAMKFALKNPSNVEKLFIEDISPLRLPKDVTETIISNLKISLDSLTSIPEGADADTAKKAVIEYIRKESKLEGLENLFKIIPLLQRDGVWQWKINVEVFYKALQDTNLFLGKMEGHYNGRTFFIYGKISPFKVNEEEDDIRKLFPNAEFFGVEGANHSIHSKHPEYLRELIKFLK